MNAAIAVHKDHVYTGSRTDVENNNADKAAIMVVNVANPASRITRMRDDRGPTRANPRANCACGARRTC